MSELAKDLDRIYKELQSLHLEPTKQNIMILADVMQVLEKAFAFVMENTKKEEPEEEKTEEGDADGVDS